MRVTIERREQTFGIFSGRRNYYADYIIQFSEEERAVITARGLADIRFPVRTPDPPRSPQLQRFLSIAGPLGLFIAILCIFLGIFARLIGYHAYDLILMGSALGFSIGFLWFFERMTAKGLDQLVEIGRIVRDGKFTIWAHDPADLKMIEVEAKEQLYGVKQRIIDSIEMKHRETFEI
jgi:hypothetical protein